MLYDKSVRISKENVESLAGRVMERAMAKGDLLGADVVYFFGESHLLSLRDGLPEENSFGVSGGISLRCVGRDGRQGVAYGNNFSDSSVNDMIEWSYRNCSASEPDEGVSLFCGPLSDDDAGLELCDESLGGTLSHGFRMRVCLEATEAARARDPRVESVRASSWSDGYGESYYAATSGISGWRRGTSVSFGVSVVMRDGDSYELGGFGRSRRRLADVDSSEISRRSVDRTLLILGGTPLPTGKYTLLLDPEVSASMIDEIGDLFSASEVHRGRSLMAGRLGDAIAGGAITLVDDARIVRGMASSAFDGEGVPTGRTVLIDSGVANAYLYNLQYAAKDGTKSTGSASRSLSGLPDVGTSNLVLMPGGESQESLARGIGRGFFVTELLGLHTINPVSGDFSLGAKGVRIEGGEFGAPVAGVTIAGNLLDFLKKITSVGSDLEFFGSTGAPTIVVEDVALGGG
jgi:PmbA protein